MKETQFREAKIEHDSKAEKALAKCKERERNYRSLLISKKNNTIVLVNPKKIKTKKQKEELVKRKLKQYKLE